MHFIEIAIHSYTDSGRQITVDEAIIFFVEMNSLRAKGQKYWSIKNCAKIGKRDRRIGTGWYLKILIREIVQIKSRALSG